MKQQVYFILTATFIGLSAAAELHQRDPRLLPFQVVKFPNDPCMVSGASYNGTCYTSEECSSLGGSSSGSCASGYGVCCIFKVGCGDSTAQNGSYFEVTSSQFSTMGSGMCSAKVCKLNDDICQIRLDFETFVISGPSTVTSSLQTNIFGINAGSTATGEIDVSLAGNCLTDTFSISKTNNVPVLCGDLADDHLYFDVRDSCHSLDIALGTAANGISTLATRAIKIKISQIGCDDPNKAPSGCLQYHMSTAGTGTLRSFNYDGSVHLANQQQVSCVRREQGKCKICWYASTATDVAVSQFGSTAQGVTKDNFCCGYGIKGTTGTIGFVYDCLMIPGAIKNSSPDGVAKGAIQCGGGKGVIQSSATSPTQTVCSKSVPFRIEFFSDGFEYSDTVTQGTTANTDVTPNIAATTSNTLEGGALTTRSKGFKISYTQSSNNC